VKKYSLPEQIKIQTREMITIMVGIALMYALYILKLTAPFAISSSSTSLPARI